MHTLTTAHDAVQWLRERVTGTLQTDSRLIRPGDGFIAWPGAATDGRAHVADAMVRGATACLVEQSGVEAFGFTGDHMAALHGLKGATGPIAAQWFDHPTSQLAVLAVTGTNGKTSTAWWLAGALNALSNRELPALAGCALVGTLGMGVAPALESTGMTTPDPVRLQRAFRQYVDQGLGACAIEASSIGLAEARLDGTLIRTAIFTNFTQDHLDYHGSMAEYWAAKARLFEWPGLRAAVVNVDDAQGATLAADWAQRSVDLWTVGIEPAARAVPARLFATDLGVTPSGMRLTVGERSVQGEPLGEVRLNLPLVGRYNVSNLLCVLASARALGVSLADAAAACTALSPVPGRMQQVSAAPGLPLVLVDYAHTPDALEKALQALQPLARERGGALWCVIGCGGDRDPGKRPLMAAVAERQAQQTVLTSDNPRSEDPLVILAQMRAGLARPETALIESDRARAIARAVQGARAQDVVLIAGKGHEDYQEILGVKRPFSDLQQAQAALQGRPAPAMGAAT